MQPMSSSVASNGTFPMKTLYGGRDGRGRDGPVDAGKEAVGNLLISPGAVGRGGSPSTAQQSQDVTADYNANHIMLRAFGVAAQVSGRTTYGSRLHRRLPNCPSRQA